MRSERRRRNHRESFEEIGKTSGSWRLRKVLSKDANNTEFLNTDGTFTENTFRVLKKKFEKKRLHATLNSYKWIGGFHSKSRGSTI